MARQIDESKTKSTLPRGYDQDEVQLALRQHFLCQERFHQFLAFCLGKIRRVAVDQLPGGVLFQSRVQALGAPQLGSCFLAVQQMVAIARAVDMDCKVLILDEPTRSIDMGTKTEIQRLVRKLAEEGMSVTFISSEIEEMLRTCSRLIVMRDRHIVGELRGTELTQDNVMRTIAGGED